MFVVKDEYRTALEYVLDSYLNYYVVKDVAEAAQAVRLLESNKKGKANFFLLNQFNSDSNAAPGKPQDGLTPALSVIQVDEQYKALAQHLLGHVYIADQIEAVTGTEVYNGNVIIEKNGKTLRGKYNLGGGSIGLFEGNKIGRAKNLERLAADIENLTASTAQLKQQISDTQTQITGFNQELNDRAIEQSRNEINKLNNQTINLAHRIENFEHLNLTGEKRLQDLQDQFSELQEGISDTRTELEEITEQLQSLQAAIQKAAEEFAAVEQDFNMATQQYNNQNIQYTRQQSKIENLKQEFSFRNNQLTDLERQIASNKDQLKETSAQISETSGKLHFGDNELYELMQKKDVDERSLSEKDRAYYEFRNAISEHESKISRQRREKEQAETLLNGIREKLGAMKLQVAGMKERLNVEFKVDLEVILEEGRKNDMTVEELNAEADRLKKRLENIGEVNPTAIEAYSEMKVRHDFIVDQKTDLEDAHNTLMATIEEIENTANAKFRETFDAVRANFVQVFKALFTEEDAADLKLTDPDNIADSGIEIYAQPKGKRPSTLTQLSGGEKTLTSTAFLFAIYLIKPAPFCILDEVDAPLDDANVGKFTQMIRKFSDNSQFIIVTHNKQTMAAVDVIYGVTMQEAGVSKLVPVDFRSLN